MHGKSNSCPTETKIVRWTDIPSADNRVPAELVLPLDQLQGFLDSIDPSGMNEAQLAKLRAYQKGAVDAIRRRLNQDRQPFFHRLSSAAPRRTVRMKRSKKQFNPN